MRFYVNSVLGKKRQRRRLDANQGRRKQRFLWVRPTLAWLCFGWRAPKCQRIAASCQAALCLLCLRELSCGQLAREANKRSQFRLRCGFSKRRKEEMELFSFCWAKSVSLLNSKKRRTQNATNMQTKNESSKAQISHHFFIIIYSYLHFVLSVCCCFWLHCLRKLIKFYQARIWICLLASAFVARCVRSKFCSFNKRDLVSFFHCKLKLRQKSGSWLSFSVSFFGLFVLSILHSVSLNARRSQFAFTVCFAACKFTSNWAAFDETLWNHAPQKSAKSESNLFNLRKRVLLKAVRHLAALSATAQMDARE